MTEITIPEALWASTMLPVGTLECWFVADGGIVKAGWPVAMIRIEDALHEIAAPRSGHLAVSSAANAVIEPGCCIGSIV